MWFFGLIVVLLIGAVAVVASGRWGAMAPAYDDRPDLTVPARRALTAADLETARFGVGLRGYRMDEVDTLLDRVARELAERDRRIADLERAVTPIIHGPEGAGFASRSDYSAADFDDTGYTEPILVGGDFAASPAAQSEPEAPAEPQAETQALQEPAPAAEPLPDTHAQPEAFEEPVTPAEPLPVTQAQPDAPSDADSVLDDQPRPPAQVPLPPLLQELVHTHESADDAESEPWFQAKEPPPDHSAIQPAESAAQADEAASADGQEQGEDDGPRGRHSAAPDVNVAQRPS